MPRKITWFFDLDNTLHNASHRIFQVLDEQINAFIQARLAVAPAAADALRLDYWRRYGATLLGLTKHHGISGPDYFAATHCFDVRPLLQFERGLARRLAALPGRKILLTNAPLLYAVPVLRALNLQRVFTEVIAIDQMQINRQYAPKPSRLMLRRLLAQRRIAPAHARLVEDSAINLKAAKTVGLQTLLVQRYTRAAARCGGEALPVHSRVKAGRPLYIDHCVQALTRLSRLGQNSYSVIHSDDAFSFDSPHDK